MVVMPAALSLVVVMLVLLVVVIVTVMLMLLMIVLVTAMLVLLMVVLMPAALPVMVMVLMIAALLLVMAPSHLLQEIVQLVSCFSIISSSWLPDSWAAGVVTITALGFFSRIMSTSF